MKITVIGAGNMGGAIAGAIAGTGKHKVTVCDPTEAGLRRMKEKYPDILTTTSNYEGCMGAELILLAVKPKFLGSVLTEIVGILKEKKPAVISIAGGVDLDKLETMCPELGRLPLLWVIPDIAITVGQSMTFVASRRIGEELKKTVEGIFDACGTTAFVDERMMNAATALCSCGIAYVCQYMDACVRAGVQMGFSANEALKYTVATVGGAVAMLQQPGTSPVEEMYKVSTPGGMTIKGLNELSMKGFESAVISAMLKPLE